jgi:hypothetical protein
MVVVPSFLTISTGFFIGHPVGGLTGGGETRVKYATLEITEISKGDYLENRN